MRQVPLEWFVFIGTFFEELISPIPSVLVMIPAGAAAQAQGKPFEYLILLAIFAAIGRVIAATILYFVADKLEDAIFAKGRKLFSLSHKDVEGYGKKLSGKNSWWVLFGLSAAPFLPTATLALASGFIKIRFATFITANFLGSIINGLLYLYIGYASVEATKLIGRFELAGQITAIAALTVLVIWLLYRRLKTKLKK